jgi:hypothetical protein
MFFVLKYEQILVSIHIHFKCRIIIVQLVLVINIDLVCFSMVHFLVCLYIFIGHACAGTAGYCDVFGKCRAVDAEGPLTRLKICYSMNKTFVHLLKSLKFVFIKNFK